jgi:HSP20 family protein
MALLARRPAAPLAGLADMQSQFDRLFEDVFDGDSRRAAPLDIIQEDGAIVLRMDVPGIKPDEVKIDVQDDVLTIRGEHEETQEEKDKRYLRRERRRSAFARSVALPAGIDPDGIEASYEHGVLEVRVPEPPKPQPKAIEVKAKD